MSGKISIAKLTLHPKNTYYFTDIEGEKYEEIKRSIEASGIRDPLKVTTSYTIVSGHQRYRIAQDLGFTDVPVDIIDVNEWEAEYLLIAENVERRGEAERDPIKKGRIASFLKEYFGIKRGGDRKSKYKNDTLKSVNDIADIIGESKLNTHRLLKLNELIPELQQMISDGLLTQTAGYHLAGLTEDEQRKLVDVKGASVGEISSSEAKVIKDTAVQSRKDDTDFIEQLEATNKQLEDENKRLASQVEELKNQPPKVIEKEVVIEKPIYHVSEVMPEQEKRKLQELEKFKNEHESKMKELQQERDKLEASLMDTYSRVQELEKLERSVQLEKESPLYDIYRSTSGTIGYLTVFLENERFAKEILANSDRDLTSKVSKELTLMINLSKRIKGLIESDSVVVIDGDFENKNLIEVIG